MRISIGLPSTIPGVPGELIFDWARQADNGPFLSLGVIGRLVYPNYEPLITLATVAGVTRRIRLMTAALLAPLYNAGVLAKQAASLDALSGGRLTLGLGIGMREEDYLAAPAAFRKRGKIFDEQLAIMRRTWSGQPPNDKVGPMGPAPAQPDGPELLIGGRSPAAFRRVAHWSSGYISSETSAQAALANYNATKEQWKAAGRKDTPRFVGIAYFGLGANAQDQINRYLSSYYAFRGPAANMVVQAASATPQKVKTTIEQFSAIGMDELLFWPCIPELDQVHRLADLVQ